MMDMYGAKATMMSGKKKMAVKKIDKKMAAKKVMKKMGKKK
jgi:hypothetical protein